MKTAVLHTSSLPISPLWLERVEMQTSCFSIEWLAVYHGFEWLSFDCQIQLPAKVEEKEKSSQAQNKPKSPPLSLLQKDPKGFLCYRKEMVLPMGPKLKF